MNERKEDWIHFQQPNGKNMIGSPDYIKKLLGLDKVDVEIRIIHNYFEEIRQRIDNLEKPVYKQRILELLSNGQAHNEVYIRNRAVDGKWLITKKLVHELVVEGKLQTEARRSQKIFSLVKGATKK